MLMSRLMFRSNLSEVFLGKGVLKICSKFTGDHPSRSAISTLQHGRSPVNLLHIFRTPFPKNKSGGLLLNVGNYLNQKFYNHNFQSKPESNSNNLRLEILFSVFSLMFYHIFLKHNREVR